MSTPDSATSAQGYWDAVAEHYDEEVTDSFTGNARRQIVWEHLERAFRRGQRVLELNCGTGADAAHLARRGVRVLACDLSPRMIEAARRRVQEEGVSEFVECRVLANEKLGQLAAEAPFDGAFSNFSGLNCVADIALVAGELSRLLRPGAALVVCVIGRLPAWEILWFLGRGRPGAAFRRLRRKGVEKGAIRVRYFSRREIRKNFAPHFTLKEWKGVGIAVPPSYLEPWARRFPGAMRALSRADRALSGVPLVRNFADSILLHMERTGTRG